MIFWIGLQPRFFLDRMAPTLDDLMKPAMQAVESEGRERQRGESRSNPQSSIINHQSTILPPLHDHCHAIPAAARDRADRRRGGDLSGRRVLGEAGDSPICAARPWRASPGGGLSADGAAVGAGSPAARSWRRPSSCGANMVLPRPRHRSISTNWPGSRAGWPSASAFCLLIVDIRPLARFRRHGGVRRLAAADRSPG